MPPKCELCQTYHYQQKPCPADPAQSAPSAEQLAMKKNLAERDAENFIYDRLGFAFKAINSSLTVTVFKPVKVMSLSQSDRKWDVVYLMDKAWDLLVELAAEKQAAALRTAQLERELVESRNMEADLNKKLETAESALRDAKTQTIKQCITVAQERNRGHHGNDCGHAVEIINTLRALLTVAAQTPEEK